VSLRKGRGPRLAEKDIQNISLHSVRDIGTDRYWGACEFMEMRAWSVCIIWNTTKRFGIKRCLFPGRRVCQSNSIRQPFQLVLLLMT
jgi:hypothetical protein